MLNELKHGELHGPSIWHFYYLDDGFLMVIEVPDLTSPVTYVTMALLLMLLLFFFNLRIFPHNNNLSIKVFIKMDRSSL